MPGVLQSMGSQKVRHKWEAEQQCTYIHSLWSLPHLPPSHSSTSPQSVRLDSVCYKATSHQLSILHMIVYIHQCYFLHLSHSLLPSLSPEAHSFPAIGSSISFFWIPYICITIEYFSLSDLLHPVLHTLDSFTSPELTQFHSFLWLIFHLGICMYIVSHLLYPVICRWISRLLWCLGYCK